MKQYDGFMEGFERRRQATLAGKLTYLPIHDIFPRLASVFPGFIPGEYVLITGASGAAKSRFTRFLFVKHVINLIHQYGINAKIFYNSTEESLEKIESTFVQSYLFKKYKLDIPFYDIMHFLMPGKALPIDTVRKIAEGKEIVDQLIRPHMHISHETNPYGFYSILRNHFFETGTFYNEDKKVAQGEMFTRYVPNDPNSFTIGISDNINNYSAEQGKTHEATLKYFSEVYCRKIVCIKCNGIIVNVQQQVGDKERIESNFKTTAMAEKLYPSLDSLAHCTHTHRDATIALGLFKPQKFSRIMPKYGGYETKINRTLTGLHILKTRESMPVTANILPMNHLPGDIFEELPKIGENLFSTNGH